MSNFSRLIKSLKGVVETYNLHIFGQLNHKWQLELEICMLSVWGGMGGAVLWDFNM